MGIGEAMKKKNKTILFVLIVIGVITLCLTYKNKNEVAKTKRKGHSNLAIIIKDANGKETNSNDIPKGNYKINEEKTHCENNGKVLNYDNTSGKISFSFIGSDRCYLYFDVIIDTEKPVIKNLNVSGTTVMATLTDDQGLSGYGFSTSNTLEPTSWRTISGTSYSLSTTITTEGTYYLWVKDGAGNKAVSDVIDLERKGLKTILANNTVNSTTPNFSSASTTNEGLYKAVDDLGTSYYFRGAVNNNWVKFGKDSSENDIYWRIIRINGDGSIRMIYSGTTAPTSSTATVMTGTGTQISTSAFNSSRDKAEYVGYMYALEQQHGNGTSSGVKTTIDNWYKTTTLETDSTTKALVSQDQIFCNDRSASSTQTAAWTSTGATYSYGARGRLYSYRKPILTCPTDSDKFTSNKGSIGNKALTYPVGLITADEVAMAGGKYGTNNSSYYLYTNQSYWSGSPYYFYSGDSAYDFIVSSYGDFVAGTVYSAYGVRPVVSLSFKAKLSGSGTYNDVYTVSSD